MALRTRHKKQAIDGDQARRWWRRGQQRASEMAGHLQDETIPAITHDLSDRLEMLREEAAPLVESVSDRVAERVPGRKRSRKSRGLRFLVIIGALAAVGYLIYRYMQRDDYEPAYLTYEPPTPESPAEPPPGTTPNADSYPNGQASDAVGSAYQYQPQSTQSN